MAMSFPPVTGAQGNTVVYSEEVRVSGLPLGAREAQIIGNDGELQINAREWAKKDTVQNGDTLRLRVKTPDTAQGETIEVTVALPAVGYLTWSVTLRNDITMDEGRGRDTPGWFVVTPLPIEEEMTGSDFIEGTAYITMGETGAGRGEVVDIHRSTTVLVTEKGKGQGEAFSALFGDVQESATGSDEIVTGVSIFIEEESRASDSLAPLLTTSHFVEDFGVGRDALWQPAYTEMIVEKGEGGEAYTESLHTSELVDDSTGQGVGDATLDAVLTAWVEDVAQATDYTENILHVVENYNNTGYGFDEILLASDDKHAWVFNARTMAISQWEGLGVYEVHEAAGRVYGLAEDGVYVFSEDTAAPARAESGLYDFGVIEEKKLRHAYLSYTSTTPIHVSLVHTDGGERRYVTYGKPAYEAVTPIQTRVNIGRGPDARYWGVVIENTDGGAAQVKDVRLVPDVISRRI